MMFDVSLITAVFSERHCVLHVVSAWFYVVVVSKQRAVIIMSSVTGADPHLFSFLLI